MGNTVEYISEAIIVCFSIALRDVRRAGALLPLFFSKGKQQGRSCLTFHHSIIRNFMVKKSQLKQIYCSYSRTRKIQNVFLHSLLLFLRSTLLLNRKKNILVKNFFIFINLHFP